MFGRIAWMIALACFALSLVMCGGTPETPEPPDATRPEAPPSKNEPEPALPDEEPADSQQIEPTPPPAEQEPEPVTPPATEPEPAPVERKPPQEPEASPLTAVSDPGGIVEVSATKNGLTDIGSQKCKVCHKVQFASWAESAHARRTPPLDCESCHGPGSEYKTMSVMKDPDKADAAGLVRPGKAFCSICHKAGWSDEMLGRAHDHKDEGA